VAFLEAADRFFDRGDVTFSLAQWDGIEPAHEPGADWIQEEFGFADEVERPAQPRRQHNRIEIALMVGDNQDAAALWDVSSAVYVKVEQCSGEELCDKLHPFPEQRMFNRQPARPR
jgi:hypothetical protein